MKPSGKINSGCIVSRAIRRLSIVAASFILVAAFMPSMASARCELAPSNGRGGKSSCNGGGTSRSSSNSNDNAAAIAAGVGLVLQGLANSSNAADEARERREAEERDRWLSDYERKKVQGKASAEALEQSAKGTADANPWATDAPKSAKASAKKESGRAPFLAQNCVTLEQRSKGRIDWDYVTVTNKCRVPVQVLMCYFMKGEEQKCKGKTGWGTSSTIQPNGQTSSVATTKTWPWQVRYFVCDMSNVVKHSKLCLLPEKL